MELGNAGNVDAAKQLADLLEEKHLTVTTAESCTGGLVSSRLVDVPGISQSLLQGLVTYSNEAKMRLLGVKEETLLAHGAVSEETAREMALGGAAACGADLCLATTGIAGPGGGTPQKPVGLVYMACALKGEVTVERWQFSGDRRQVREQAAQKVLELAIRLLRA